MPVSYKRVQYYSLGRPYYDNKVLPSGIPNALEIMFLTNNEDVRQIYYLQEPTLELKGRSPFVISQNDVVCNQTTYLTYLSQDKRYIFIFFRNFNNSLDLYMLTNSNITYPPPVIDWECGDVVSASNLIFNTLCVDSTGSGCDWVKSYEVDGVIYKFPKDGTSSVGGQGEITIRYIF